MKNKYRVQGREVQCMNCEHRFKSYTIKPRCSKCDSSRIENLEDIPRQYGGQKLIDIDKDVIELKESQEFNLRMFRKLLDRIKALEART